MWRTFNGHSVAPPHERLRKLLGRLRHEVGPLASASCRWHGLHEKVTQRSSSMCDCRVVATASGRSAPVSAVVHTLRVVRLQDGEQINQPRCETSFDCWMMTLGVVRWPTGGLRCNEFRNTVARAGDASKQGRYASC